MLELIKFSLKRRFGNGAQILLNVILMVVIGAALFADGIIEVINPDMLESPLIYVGDMDENIKQHLLTQPSTLFRFKEAKAKDNVKGSSTFLLTQNNDFTLTSQYPLDPTMKEALTALIAGARQEAILKETKGENASLNAFISPIVLKNKVKEKHKNGDEQQSNLIFMVITGIYFMMISFATTVANEVVYEKATKTLELILTSVSAKVHFISKMIVGWLVVFIQCISVCGYAIFWVFVRNGYDQGVGILKLVNKLRLASISQKTFGAILQDIQFDPQWVLKIIFVFLFLFAGILLIQLLMVIVSSFISNIEEAGNVQSPFYIVMLGVYYLTISLNSPYHLNEGIGYYFSFVPFLSMLFMPCRILQGTATIYELFLSFAIATGTFFLLVKHGSKVYQKGVLDYSSKGLLHIFKQIKNT